MAESFSMERIATLGRELDRRWRDQGYRDSELAALATEALAGFMAAKPPAPEALVRWAIGVDELPRQANVPISFGQPPLTLYRTDRFYIEALFWLDGTTAIHDHAFAGAFGVLAGSSLHTTFAFRQTEQVDARTRIGALERVGTELLETGAVRSIVAGRSFIHSLFHLDRPSVSLTVRTYADAEAYPQLEYRRPGLAMDSSFAPEGPARRLAVLDMLANLDSVELPALVAEYLAGSDLLHAFRALEQLAVHPLGARHLRGALDSLAPAHRPYRELVAAALDETVRQRNIHGRRQLVHDPAHRFVLALLLNVTERAQLLDMLARRTGAADPIAELVTCLRALSAGGPDTLGIALDAGGLATLEGLLRGWTEQEISQRAGLSASEVARWALKLPHTQLLRRLLE